MNGIFHILVPLALAAVVIALLAGLYTLFKGGDVARSWSNKMMRLRVLTQFIAVVVLVAAYYWGARG